MILPALLAPQLEQLSAYLATAVSGGSPEQSRQKLQALTGRLLLRGGLTASSRNAGAEPLCTGRARPYDESTLRLCTARWASVGGTAFLASMVENQVKAEVATRGQRVVAYTDMHDQPYFTKIHTHAAPIGRLNNKIVAATYLGVSTIALGPGKPTLFWRLSWHKPGAPLADAMQELYNDPQRRKWARTWIHAHNLDRGGNGRRIRGWLAALHIPYFTLSNQDGSWKRYQHPTALTPEGLPVFVRKDSSIEVATHDAAFTARVVIYPAHPERGERSTKALRYHTTAELTVDEQQGANDFYKRRWPEMENKIKDLVAAGFSVNRHRKLELTSSRGDDGKQTRLVEQEQALVQDIAARGPARTKAEQNKVLTRKRKLRKNRLRQAAHARRKPTLYGRARDRGELFSKNLLLLMLNTITLLLSKSHLEQILSMTVPLLQDLLLGRPALASVGQHETTLWIEPVCDARQYRLQQELVRLIDAERLVLNHRKLRIRLSKRIGDPP